MPETVGESCELVKLCHINCSRLFCLRHTVITSRMEQILNLYLFIFAFCFDFT